MNKQLVLSCAIIMSFFLHASDEISLVSYESEQFESQDDLVKAFFENNYHKHNDFYEVLLLTKGYCGGDTVPEELENDMIDHLNELFNLQNFSKREKISLSITILSKSLQIYEDEAIAELPWYSRVLCINKSSSFLATFYGGVSWPLTTILGGVLGGIIERNGNDEMVLYKGCLVTNHGYRRHCPDWYLLYGPMIASSCIGIAAGLLAKRRNNKCKQLSGQKEEYEVLFEILKKHGRING